MKYKTRQMIIIFSLTAAMFGCGGGGGGGDNSAGGQGSETIGVFDATTEFDPGIIALSMSPEDKRLASMKDQSGKFWDFFGTRDVNGIPTSMDRIEVSSGTSKMTIFSDSNGRPIRMESVDSATGKSSALQFTYLPNNEVRVDGFNAVTTDPNNPDASGTMTLPSPLPTAKSSKVTVNKTCNKTWREIQRDTDQKALRQAIMQDELSSALSTDPLRNAPALPAKENIKATFEVTVKTRVNVLVEDATVQVHVFSGPSGQIIGPVVTAVNLGNGVYKGTVTLVKATVAADLIKACDNLKKFAIFGTAAVSSVALVARTMLGLAAASNPLTLIVGVAGAVAVTEFIGVFSGGLDMANSLGFVDAAWAKGVCAGVTDFISNTRGDDLTVRASVIGVASRLSLPTVVGDEATVPIAQIASGQQRDWILPEILIPNPVSGGLEDVSVSTRNITFTFRDTGVEDGDEVNVLLQRPGSRTSEVIFTGTLTNAGISRGVTLSAGVNTIEVLALNQGSLGRNTAGIQISNVVSGNASQSWGLTTLEQATFTIFAP